MTVKHIFNIFIYFMLMLDQVCLKVMSQKSFFFHYHFDI